MRAHAYNLAETFSFACVGSAAVLALLSGRWIILPRRDPGSRPWTRLTRALFLPFVSHTSLLFFKLEGWQLDNIIGDL